MRSGRQQRWSSTTGKREKIEPSEFFKIHYAEALLDSLKVG